MSDPRIGAVLDDRYRIVSLIASGSMGAIYRGERLKLGRSVAIKVLHTPLANQERFIQRFEVEAKALSRLSHPNCVSIIDFGVADAPYLVMDYVPGRTLKELIDQRHMPVARALHIFRQVLAGLAHAHGHGITHRDIKPGNVMLTEATGTGDHIRLLDFGLAKLHNAAMAPDETGSAKVVGTPFYMSPEQASGKQGDVRSDLYSAGVLLFELLTGAKPFDSEEMLEVLNMHVEHAPPLLRSAGGQRFSEELEAVVQKTLAKKPERRYQTALELAAALDETPEAGQPLHRFYAQTKPLTSEGTAELPLIEQTESPRWRLMVLALVLVGAAAVAAYFHWFRPRTEPAVDPTPAPALAPDAAPDEKPDTSVADTAPPQDVVAPDTGVPGDLGSADAAQAGGDDEETRDLPPFGIARVKALIKAGREDDAIAELLRLRKRSKSAYVDYLLGKLYFDKRWWSVAMQHYQEAIRKNRVYRTRAPLIQDLITALVDRKTGSQAEQILVRDVGKAALPHLSHASKHHPLAEVRKTTARVARRIR